MLSGRRMLDIDHEGGDVGECIGKPCTAAGSSVPTSLYTRLLRHLREPPWDQSTFHFFVTMSSSLLTRSSIDHIMRVKKIFIHLHQT